ncbi:MAG: hypothetical protein ACE5D7_06315 [Fidelibacterota bacterium]
MVLYRVKNLRLFIIVFFTCLHSNNTEKDLAKSFSIIPHQSADISKVTTSISIFNYPSDIKFMLNSQLWFSPNLYAKGGIAPGKYDAFVSTLYHYGVGYVLDIPWSGESTTAIEFGEFHLKWYDNNHFKWQYGLIAQSLTYHDFQFHFLWTHFLEQKWKHDQFSLIFSRNIGDVLGYQLQTDLYWTGSKIKLNPFITISASL